MKEQIAYHEAGHCVGAWTNGCTVTELRFAPDAWEAKGRCENELPTLPENATPRAFMEWQMILAQIALAGPMAAARACSDARPVEKCREYAEARKTAEGLSGKIVENPAEQILAAMLESTEKMLQAKWPQVEQIAALLLQRWEVSGPVVLTDRDLMPILGIQPPPVFKW